MRTQDKMIMEHQGRRVYCSMASPDRFEELMTHLRLIHYVVDRIVIICNNSGKKLRWTENMLEKLRYIGAETYVREWTGNFPEARNEYLLKCQYGDWLIVSDSDEHFSDSFTDNLDEIFEKIIKGGHLAARINAHDKTYPFGWKNDDPEPEELISSHMKLLLFKYLPNMQYKGIGNTKTVHESLEPAPKFVDLPKEYYYTHIKQEWEVWARAARNLYHNGGGNDVGTENPEWQPLIRIIEKLGYDNWYDFEEYLKKGKIASELSKWLIRNRRKGLDYMNEAVDFFKYYFYYLHPEEKPKGQDIIEELEPGGMAETLKIVEGEYMKYFGRHPSNEEKRAYTDKIISGLLTWEDLGKIFIESDEYKRINKDKQQEEEEEFVERLPLANLPINIDLKITPEIMNQILRHSVYYNTYIKPLINIGKRWMLHTSINNKIETQGKGNDKQPREQYKHYIANITKFIPPNDFRKILDLGAGAGDETIELIEAGYEVIGLTLGEDNVKYAKENYNIDLLHQDMHFLEFPKNYVDAVILIHTYEHSYAPMFLLGEIYYVLRDYGRIYVAVPHPDMEESHTIWHVNLRNSNQIINEFMYWGFKLTKEYLETKGGRDEYTFVFEKLPPGHELFENWGYLQHIYQLREQV